MHCPSSPTENLRQIRQEKKESCLDWFLPIFNKLDYNSAFTSKSAQRNSSQLDYNGVPQCILALACKAGYLRPGFIGSQRKIFYQVANSALGEDNWEFQHRVRERIYDRKVALKLYEDAYIEFFKKFPKLAEKISTYKDVYDTNPTNTESRYDYDNQESPEKGTHLHDIAIRNALKILGYKFNPNGELLQVRGKKSLGYSIGPGVVPFHKPEIIPAKPKDITTWYKDATIEDYYQSSRYIVIKNTNKFTPALLASKFLEKFVPLILCKEVELTQIENMPWKFLLEEFPKDENGKLIKFSKEDIVNTAMEAVKGLYYLSQNIPNFPEFKTIPLGELLRNLKLIFGEDPISPNDEFANSFAGEVRHIKNLKDFINCIEKHSLQPRHLLLLARDSFSLNEFINYLSILGINVPKTSIVYMPGSPKTHTSKNERNYDGLKYISKSVQKLWECLATSRQYNAATIRTLLDNSTRDPSIANIMARIKESVIRQNKTLPNNFLVVDMHGTGKSSLFVEYSIRYYLEMENRTPNSDVLLGSSPARQNLVPTVFQEQSHLTYEDLHWPFKTARTNEICTKVFLETSNSLLAWVKLAIRTMLIYNEAIDKKLASNEH